MARVTEIPLRVITFLAIIISDVTIFESCLPTVQSQFSEQSDLNSVHLLCLKH